MSNLLVVPKGFLGDIILTTPTIEALKLSNPECRITFLCSPKIAELVRRDPLVDDVIEVERADHLSSWGAIGRFAAQLAERRFDRAYAFHQSPRTALLLYRARIRERVGYSGGLLSFLYTRKVTKTERLHEVIRNLELVRADLNEEVGREVDTLARTGPTHVSSFGRVRMPAEETLRISDLVRQICEDQKPFVLLAPGSQWETKRWHAQGFHELAKMLLRSGFRVVVTGAPSDAEACVEVASGLNVANLCGETTLDDLTALVRWSRGLVCNDSMTLHIASALGVPTVVVFCATSPAFGFGPWKNRAVVVEKRDLFCKPCRRHGSRSCPTGTRACMTGVAAEEVFAALQSLVSLRETAAGGQGRLHVIE